eukprot:PhF_6_TR9768/c0_g1_i2/m.15054
MFRLALILVALWGHSVRGLEQYQQLIPNGMNVPGWPAVGHTTASATTSSGRNRFGQDFQSAGFKWTVALCQKDSDGDGFSNGIELGDPSCTWKVGNASPTGTSITHPGQASSYPSPAATTTATTPAPSTVTPSSVSPVITTAPVTTATPAPPTVSVSPPGSTKTDAPSSATTQSPPAISPTAPSPTVPSAIVDSPPSPSGSVTSSAVGSFFVTIEFVLVFCFALFVGF